MFGISLGNWYEFGENQSRQKNVLMSSSGILIPHLSGSFRVIFPYGLLGPLWTASRSFMGVPIIECVLLFRSPAISGAPSSRPFHAASQTSRSWILPLRYAAGNTGPYFHTCGCSIPRGLPEARQDPYRHQRMSCAFDMESLCGFRR